MIKSFFHGDFFAYSEYCKVGLYLKYSRVKWMDQNSCHDKELAPVSSFHRLYYSFSKFDQSNQISFW